MLEVREASELEGGRGTDGDARWKAAEGAGSSRRQRQRWKAEEVPRVDWKVAPQEYCRKSGVAPRRAVRAGPICT